jgi:hypothetical protein
MNNRRLRLAAALAAIVTLSLLFGSGGAMARESVGVTGPAEPESPAANETLVFSYAAKFVCQEPIPVATVSVGRTVPLIRESTDVLVHNPNGFDVTFYKKAVLAPLESAKPVEPGKWHRFDLKPDYAMRLDCDEITKLLTGDPAATFVSKYGIGVRVEGYVVIGIGPQAVAGTAANRYAPLDVTAQYARGSEVLKKDIRLQPWWHWWWWPLPWRLGYPYERLIPLGMEVDTNVDCRGLLYGALRRDVGKYQWPDAATQTATLHALDEGEKLGPANLPLADAQPPALAALIGRCNKIVVGSTLAADVDYVLVSNKAPSDPSPIAPMPPYPPPYPWIAGRWYDLTVVLPQQHSIDLDNYIRSWYAARWTDNGADQAAVVASMVFFFPWWCGTSYWWGWGPGDCVDIGVGEGESLDVLQITPSRVFMTAWPPVAIAGG